MKRLLLAVIFSFVAGAAWAQVDRATLSGEVRDSTGGVIANSAVVLTNLESKLVTRVSTTKEGNYFAVNLAPGRYLVEAEAPGFEKSAQAVILEVGQKGRLDFTLGLGARTEAITVEDATPLLNTEEAALGTVIDQSRVAKLPLAIRNWDDLLVLVAGVQGNRYTEEGGGTSFGRTGGINVHGNRSLHNNFLLDGVDNNSISTNVQELTTQVLRPSIDAIQEFKVVTSPYSAEYGRNPGAAISVTTKSGTNTIHGTVYDFYRNDRYDSNTFFAKRAGQPKPTNEQNQLGGNVGGPIVKDKAFFFIDYERTRIARGVTRLSRIPDANERRGIFSSSIRDPLTGQPFPNNTIPPGRIDPVAARIFALMPAPNQPGANNFFRQPDVQDDADRVLARLDLKPTNNDSVFARYFWSDRDRFIPGLFGGTIDGTGTSAFGRQDMRAQGLVLGWTRIFGPTVVNEFRFSWSRAHSDAVQDPFGQNGPEVIGLRGIPDDPRINGGITGVTIDTFFGGGGLGRIGSPDFLPKFQRTDQFEFQDSLTWLRGDHHLKFGLNVLAPMKNEYLDIPATRGALRFRGSFTGNPVADFLLGFVQEAQLSNVYVVDQRHWATSFFVQDDWKVTSRLALNLGLRYDFITPALEADNRQTNFDPAGSGSLVFASDGSLEDRGLVKPDYNNIAPRLGIVYKLDDRTVLRGGYGTFYSMFDRIGSEDQLALNPPGLINNVVSTSSTTTPVFLLRDGFPANFLAPLNLDPAAGQLRRIRLRAVDRNAPKTTIHQFSAGIQRQFAEVFVVSANVVRSLGRNLANLVNLNQPIGGSGPLPYPNFGFIEWREHKATSSYKGLVFSFEKRFSKGYGFGLAYTLSESIDQSAEHLAAGGSSSFPQDAQNLKAWEGPSGFDVRHRFGANFVAELPFGEGKRWANSGAAKALLGDWLVSAIYAVSSGRPFTVTQSSNNVGVSMTGLPDRIGDGKGQQTVDSWFDPTAFRAVRSGTFGNSGRNILRGPGWQSFDLSVQRKIKANDRFGATLRWDVFNVFNRTNFGLPDANISSRTVGTISSLAGDPRIMQFSLRVDF